jgi:hypothetical protein
MSRRWARWRISPGLPLGAFPCGAALVLGSLATRESDCPWRRCRASPDSLRPSRRGAANLQAEPRRHARRRSQAPSRRGSPSRSADQDVREYSRPTRGAVRGADERRWSARGETRARGSSRGARSFLAPRRPTLPRPSRTPTKRRVPSLGRTARPSLLSLTSGPDVTPGPSRLAHQPGGSRPPSTRHPKLFQSIADGLGRSRAQGEFG